MDDVDCVVVGGGVIGLAVARSLARIGREVVILEREPLFGSHTSSRNSEVIHAGIYYPINSLKARTCVAGRKLLYEYCNERGIAHRRCGKLIVATSEEQLTQLQTMANRALQNGVEDLRMLDGCEARHLEPAIECVGALLSPSTGIIDSHAYMLSLLGDAETGGATVVYSVTVSQLQPTASGVEVSVDSHDMPALRSNLLVNCAGLEATTVARTIKDFPKAFIPEAWFAKGSYFELAGRAPFSRLIYPLPEPGGLGIHLTLDLAGKAKFGPDVEWVDSIDYNVDPRRAKNFYPAIRRYWPALTAGALHPGYAGVRPKINGPDEAAADFCVSGPQSHGVEGIINLFGIESPGLTASLALAQEVSKLAGRPE